MTAALKEFAQELVETLRPACVKVEIAGGLRRGKPDPHDIEIVCLPRFDEDLFGQPSDTYSHLDALLDSLVDEGTLQWDEEVKRRGPRYKRFTVGSSAYGGRFSPALEGMAVELFLAHRPENYGVVMAIRTGDADFTKFLVTPQLYQGLLPNLLCVKEGCLYRYPTYRDADWARKHKGVGKGVLVACCTELDFFNALRLPVPDPSERNAEGASKLRRIVEGQGR